MIRTLRSPAIVLVLAVAACSGSGGGNTGGAAQGLSTAPVPTTPVPTSGSSPGTPRSANVHEYLGPVYGVAAVPLYLGCDNAGCVEALTIDGVPATLSAGFNGRGEIAHIRTTRPGYLAVDVQHTVIGPIEAIDVGAGRLTVLGQQVYVLDWTWTSGPGQSFPDLGALRVGDFVAVSGEFTAAGDVYATNLTPVAPGALLLRGILAASDGGGLRIGSLEVDLSAAALEGFPASAPLPGDAVLLRAHGPWAGGRLVAQAAKLTSGVWNVIEASNGDTKHLRGFVTASRSPDDFDVGGYRVDLRGCACEPLPTAPAVGTPVEIDPRPGDPPTAVRLHLVTWRSTTVTGPIEHIDAEQGSITVLGITAQVLPATYVVGGPVPAWELPLAGENLLMPLMTPGALSDLAVGDVVTVVGGGRGERFVAGGVFRLAAGYETAVLGTTLRVIDGETIRVFGREILTDGATRVSDCTYGVCQSSTLQTFFSVAKGQYFPPTLDIVVESPTQPLRARAIRVWWDN